MPLEVVPPISALKANYPTPDRYDRAALYKQFGMEAPAGEAWLNTCAVRMSYCLLKCDITLGKEPGRGRETVIRTGPYEGKDFWLSRKNLADRVEKLFGKPTYTGQSSTIDLETLKSKIGTTGGIISYGKLEAEGSEGEYPGGHIDVVYYWESFWFWSGYSLMGQDFDRMSRRAVEIKFWKSGG